ncbi:alpha/beta hydrolase [Pseudohalioglobus sediminis]|uniref:Alpha/beta hydrolase n=1 Tax=Pseudohalioglobus sediminis TaxID=2606449 RepID=A0A5B0WZ73_9GAMM|nr:alpha/beta hydrolase [Pseudohalioglobus sediminis]KAA1192370.1 alpha/beta hydrolase [Pseudohalioglobus sediminis]
MSNLAREDGKQVYYEDYGAGDAAVVLIHGWGTTVRAWDYTLPGLAMAGHRVVLLDHRGCGQSSKDFADMSIEAIAGDVVALVEHLGLTRVVLNGWSLGGAVAVAAAQALGARCSGLVLTCGATPCYLQKADYPHGGTDEALAETVTAMAADRVNFLAALSAGVCASEVSQQVTDWMTNMFLESSPQAASSLAALGPLDQRDILQSLTVPVLGFVGAQDAVVDPAVCRSVADYASDVRLVECAGSGHAPFIEESELYLAELLQFLGSNL